MSIKKNGKRQTITNSHVVPYNAKLLLKYDCHINVEVCSTIRSVKYLYKYVYKGSDRTMIKIAKPKTSKKTTKAKRKERDEIKDYIDCRYISSIEAAYRLLEFSMHGRFPAVLPLMVHLPDEQYVIFDTDKTMQQLKEAVKKSRKTTLKAWFDNNAKETETPLSDEELGYDIDGNLKPRGPELLYHEYPKYYKFEGGKFHRRKDSSTWQLGRLHTAHPSHGQRWYLRILLTHIRGATGYLDLLTYTDEDGKTRLFTCFKKRCIAEGLLRDDKEWDAALEQAANFKMPTQLRRFFAMIVKECHPQNANQLFERYKNDMIEDMVHEFRKTHPQRSNPFFKISQKIIQEMYNSALFDICSILDEYDIDPSDHELTRPLKAKCFKIEPKEMMNERKYNPLDCKDEYDDKYTQMNDQQKKICDELIANIYEENQSETSNNLFFIDAPGGTVCCKIIFFFFLDSENKLFIF